MMMMMLMVIYYYYEKTIQKTKKTMTLKRTAFARGSVLSSSFSQASSYQSPNHHLQNDEPLQIQAAAAAAAVAVVAGGKTSGRKNMVG
jgi:hypothetical protein